MKRLLTMTAILLLALVAAAQQADGLQVRQLTLPNGMSVWLNEDHSQPRVFGAVVVKAGAIDCPDTGIAHYFEHIMFKGTDSIGTIGYDQERPWLDSIAARYELLAQTSDALGRRHLQQDINRLSLRAADYAIPNEFNRLIAEYGGTGLNAATSYDYTYYYNTFAPQYIRQWLTLNSHRLRHPVYRLFQGELETVYEEKNRSADNPLMGALEHGMKELFAGTPYEYPIIGSTDNLKNPRMSEMAEFYKKFYVPGNMGLILCGDFDPDVVERLLAGTFGTLEGGPTPHREAVKPRPLQGERTVKLKIPLPLIKASGLAFRAPGDFEADAPALDLATRLLSNEGETGLLDSLVNEQIVMAAFADRMAMNGVGALIVGAIPKVPFGSKRKAEQQVWQQVERIRQGQFSDETLSVLKMEMQREASTDMENLDTRAMMMVDVFAQGRQWDDYLRQVEAIRTLTRQDVERVARQYFTQDRIRFVKRFGMYAKDKIEKPDFAPVHPAHAEDESDYARRLRTVPTVEKAPRLINLSGDAETLELQPGVKLYAVRNPKNDVFRLSLRFHEGTLSDPVLDPLASYVAQLGTDSLKLQQLKTAFQRLGSTFRFSAEDNYFDITMEGFDQQLLPSMALLSHTLLRLKADEKVKNQMVKDMRAGEKSIWKSNEAVLSAILQKVRFGKQSKCLTHLTPDELSLLSADSLVSRFRRLLTMPFDIVYSGTLPAEEVARMAKSVFSRSGERGARSENTEQARTSAQTSGQHLSSLLASRSPLLEKGIPVARPAQRYDQPMVYVYDMPSARQSIIATYQGLPPQTTARDRALLRLFARYFGGGMSSLMFQEVREFRSLAYSAAAAASLPPAFAAANPASMITYIGTQADKSMQAVALLDTLLTQMPMRQVNLNVAQKGIISSVSNGFPSFREIGVEVADLVYEGYTTDPNAETVALVPTLQPQDVMDYYEQQVRPATRITVIVGDKRKLNLNQLARYGQVVMLQKNDFYKR